MNEREDRKAQEPRRVAGAHQLGRRRVGEGDHASPVDDDRVRRGFDQPPVSVFGLAERFRGPVLLDRCSEHARGRSKCSDLGR